MSEQDKAGGLSNFAVQLGPSDAEPKQVGFNDSFLAQAIKDTEPYVNVDCQDILRWAGRSGGSKDDLSLYHNLLDYPSEILPLWDSMLIELAASELSVGLQMHMIVVSGAAAVRNPIFVQQLGRDKLLRGIVCTFDQRNDSSRTLFGKSLLNHCPAHAFAGSHTSCSKHCGAPATLALNALPLCRRPSPTT